ncbi:hypothetical protein [Streptomyces hyderabadensis]|uniref:HEPN domain-containing protein n=1 Tax=Streptomyces hyderabadensis TaxID=598549 RepID=A0ABP9HXD2_9ACTN|nr:hypothetical protein [Streptomyces hyderabadensis]
MDASDEIAEPSDPAPWPSDDADLLREESDWWAVACMDWPRDRWLGYINGYWKAAEAICDQIISSGRSQDQLVYPFVMCWRHYAELHLKTLIELARTYLDEAHVPLRTHKIDVLWCAARPLLERAFPSDDQSSLDNAERVLLQLHAMDPTSEHFRYPVRNDGSSTLDGIARIHVRNFHNVMLGVANLLDGADTGLRVMIDTKNEIAEYYRDWTS